MYGMNAKEDVKAASKRSNAKDNQQKNQLKHERLYGCMAMMARAVMFVISPRVRGCFTSTHASIPPKGHLLMSAAHAGQL
ncbi:MAG: hypothetical protein VYE61_02395 [Pseudomonadota bacterium]|nr:hypothetical protein [Pseudomonadota bacterium]